MVILNSLSNNSYHYFFRVDFWKFFDPCSGHGFLFVCVPWLFMLVSVHLTKEPSFLVFRDRFYEGSTRCRDLSFLNVELSVGPFTLLFHLHQEALLFLFTFCHKGGVIWISEAIDISPRNLVSSLCFIHPSILHDVFCRWVK